MKNTDLRVLAVQFLRKEAAQIQKRPHQLVYSAKMVSSSVGGYAGNLGHIAEQIVSDLTASGINCIYRRDRTRKEFVLSL
jgi:hypothetical protein